MKEGGEEGSLEAINQGVVAMIMVVDKITVVNRTMVVDKITVANRTMVVDKIMVDKADEEEGEVVTRKQGNNIVILNNEIKTHEVVTGVEVQVGEEEGRLEDGVVGVGILGVVEMGVIKKIGRKIQGLALFYDLFV